MPDSLEAIQKQLQMYTERNSAGPKGVARALLERGKAIYGSDSRLETRDSGVPPDIASAVCVLFETTKLRPTPGGYRLQTAPFGSSYKLCPGQLFAEQPLLGYGSGFLVAPDVVATAGHCVDGRDITEVAFLFDFVAAPEVRHDRRADEIYYGAEVLHYALTQTAEDYALVRLDRPVAGVGPMQISDQEPNRGEKVYVVGHPVGLPKKYAGDAIVTDSSCEGYFVTNLDAFGGNSGSPVLDVHHRVRGILVRGENDFVYDGDCKVMATFPLYRGGEHVCRASTWRHLVGTARGERTADLGTPSSGAPGPDPCEELERYLLSAYTVSELRRLARYGGSERVAQKVSFTQAPLAVVADLVDALRQDAALDAAFFGRMREDRPRRAGEVDRIESFFVSAGASAHGRRVTASPGPTASVSSGRPSRRQGYDALLGLSPGDFDYLINFEIDENARQQIRGIDKVASRAIALVNHYDVPHRGLDRLMALITKVQGS